MEHASTAASSQHQLPMHKACQASYKAAAVSAGPMLCMTPHADRTQNCRDNTPQRGCKEAGARQVGRIEAAGFEAQWQEAP